ncbi:hypothetical protein HFO41_35490 [Rhizobium leguminosarum]|nr:hypothetical protein [Rhizobium leguminosarum]MBY5338713.1 hypothetical protein [Rhizobium leguminosarum]MBY5565647.1 hypothetical protein [Rhizobium leguminosarum]MBY5626514.1 hypothetical protein [Rhizobium leguminosarum]MBY5639933.1 hypothetical protein [Rhizobium leguminosarum]MBY5694023.1 hypothetical protein [Rhizobium leguminosarum]
MPAICDPIDPLSWERIWADNSIKDSQQFKQGLRPVPGSKDQLRKSVIDW